MMSGERYSIIIPVYNEAERIGKNIRHMFDFFLNSGTAFEIIFVNDGSTDTTEHILKTWQREYRFDIISYATNRGKGHAVRAGALAASGDWIIFFDVDLATPLTEFSHMLAFKHDRDAVIIGSRRLASSEIKKSESCMRVALGKGFNLLSRVFVPEVVDFTCGFKCFSRAAAHEIFTRARINRWAFDTEVLYIAACRSLPVRQMPVIWAHDDDSKVRVMKDVVSSAWELISIAAHRLRGHYS